MPRGGGRPSWSGWTFTGRRAFAGGLRMVLIGGGAGAVTWLIGSLLGAAIG